MLNIQNDFVDAYRNRGIAHFFLQQYEQAISNFDILIEINPNDSEAHQFREYAYEALDQDE